MKECILDYLLADPDLTLDEVINLIEFHMEKTHKVLTDETKEDLKHAFAN